MSKFQNKTFWDFIDYLLTLLDNDEGVDNGVGEYIIKRQDTAFVWSNNGILQGKGMLFM